MRDVAIDPGDGKILVACDNGLFELDPDALVFARGPIIDIAGFAVVGHHRYLASGHPLPGRGLADPVGLIESTDGGQTWSPLSREGRSDFHALTVSATGVLAFDGSLLRSTDGQEWMPLSIPAPPLTLATTPDGSRILATTSQGVLGSEDAGATWTRLDDAPPLQLVAWADDTTAVGADRTGAVWISSDAAETWRQTALMGAEPRAIAAVGVGGSIRVVVATADEVADSHDGGQTFEVVMRR